MSITRIKTKKRIAPIPPPLDKISAEIATLRQQAKLYLLRENWLGVVEAYNNIIDKLGLNPNLRAANPAELLLPFNYKKAVQRLTIDTESLLIIINGPSGIGKTTLAILLEESTKRSIIHLDDLLGSGVNEKLKGILDRSDIKRLVVEGNLYDTKWFPDVDALPFPWDQTCFISLEFTETYLPQKKYIFARIFRDVFNIDRIKKLKPLKGNPIYPKHTATTIPFKLPNPKVRSGESILLEEIFPPVTQIRLWRSTNDPIYLEAAQKQAEDLRCSKLLDLYLRKIK